MRMARGYLKWSARELAEAAKVGIATINRMEMYDGIPDARIKTIQAVNRVLKKVLDKRGVELIAENDFGSGIRLKKPIGE